MASSPTSLTSKEPEDSENGPAASADGAEELADSKSPQQDLNAAAHGPAAAHTPHTNPDPGVLSERLATEPERLLDLPTVLDEFVKEGFVSQRQAEDILIAPRTKKELLQHAMEIVAAREYENRNDPGATFDLETMTLWLAETSRQPYVRIDPLKINVNAVTEVMSYAFAQRHQILALEVSDDEVVIASAQPYMYQWEGMLTQTLRGRRIKRVVVNPADLNLRMLEFYTMARSVAKAADAGFEVSAVANFEQMLELGSLKSPEANDAHIVNIVDWLLQYAFDQRASDIHIEPRRD
ncbi:MAG: hypothetical protein V3T18_05000, partial [Pseudomonadales bacterium]